MKYYTVQTFESLAKEFSFELQTQTLHPIWTKTYFSSLTTQKATKPKNDQQATLCWPATMFVENRYFVAVVAPMHELQASCPFSNIFDVKHQNSINTAPVLNV